MSQDRRPYMSVQKKVEILKKLSMNNAKVSEICEEYGVKPSSVYKWQNELFSRAHIVLETKRGPKAQDRSAEKIAALEQKLAKKDGVIAELLQEHCELKKSLGEA